MTTNVNINDFTIMKKLGQGAYGKVYLARQNDREFAIKKLSKDFLIKTQKVKSVLRERDLLINANSHMFPKLYHSFMDDEYCYIVMEYVSNGTLQSYLSTASNGLKTEMV